MLTSAAEYWLYEVLKVLGDETEQKFWPSGDFQGGNVCYTELCNSLQLIETSKTREEPEIASIIFSIER